MYLVRNDLINECNHIIMEFYRIPGVLIFFFQIHFTIKSETITTDYTSGYIPGDFVDICK